MIASNIYNLYIKCYLKLFKIVADKMHSYPSLAMLLNNSFFFSFLMLKFVYQGIIAIIRRDKYEIEKDNVDNIDVIGDYSDWSCKCIGGYC